MADCSKSAGETPKWSETASKPAAEKQGSKKPSKVEEKDAKRRQKALEKQVSRAEVERGRLSDPSLSVPGFSRPLLPEPLVHSSNVIPQAWSPEGAGELSPQLASHSNREKICDPFSCVAPASWQQPTHSGNYAPEATLTPTAVGLRPSENLEVELLESIKVVISQAISQRIAAGL